MAALEAETPKISTGIVSGRTRTASSRPPRRSATDSAAPIRPMNVSAGVPASSVSATAALRASVQVHEQAEQRHRDHQRQAGGEPMRRGLGGDRELERRLAHQDQVERAVLGIGGQQAIEREQARQQCAEPKDRRPDARPAARGRDRSRTGSARQRSGRTARRCRRRRRRGRRGGGRARTGRRAGSCGFSQSQQLACPLQPNRAVGGGKDEPAARLRCCRINPVSVRWASASRADVGSSAARAARRRGGGGLVQQPDGATSRRAIDSRRRCPADR